MIDIGKPMHMIYSMIYCGPSREERREDERDCVSVRQRKENAERMKEIVCL